MCLFYCYIKFNLSLNISMFYSLGITPFFLIKNYIHHLVSSNFSHQLNALSKTYNDDNFPKYYIITIRYRKHIHLDVDGFQHKK